jgi:S1-C subfamily serine protease
MEFIEMETNEKESGNNLSDFSAHIAKAVETVGMSVVAIDARPRVATSGIIWREGIIVSTNHTIQRDDEITVGFADGRTAKATLVGRDAGTDLAVLKIDDEEIAKSLKPAEIAETSEIKVGNIVLAVGRTSAEANAVTASFGIVNQTGGAWRTWRGDEIERFMSLDLTIYLGFSGGALINADGKVLGVNTSAFGRGLALTIPSETVNRVVDVLLTKGKITRPYLGIGTQTVPISENLRERLNLEQTSGLMMLNVEADGAAEEAGILIGDILLAIDEKTTLEPMDVQSALWGKEAGNTVNAKLLRGGELKEVEITLGERPAREHDGHGRRRKRGWGRRGC